MSITLFASNVKVENIIFELSNIYNFNVKLLTEVQDGVEEATLIFNAVLWSEEIEDITKSIADLLVCNQTFYAYDKAKLKIIVTFKK
jgi:hypothetical protein